MNENLFSPALLRYRPSAVHRHLLPRPVLVGGDGPHHWHPRTFPSSRLFINQVHMFWLEIQGYSLQCTERYCIFFLSNSLRLVYKSVAIPEMMGLK